MEFTTNEEYAAEKGSDRQGLQNDVEIPQGEIERFRAQAKYRAKTSALQAIRNTGHILHLPGVAGNRVAT